MGFSDLQLRPGERLLMSGPANKWQTIGSKGGKLFLTDQRIVFKAHALNFGSKVDDVDLSAIQLRGNTLYIYIGSNAGISSNITLYTTSGEKLAFVVTNKQRDAWIYWITQAVCGYVRSRVSVPQNVPQAQASQYASQIRVIRCEGCGALVIVAAGQLTKCDYCGRPHVG